MDEVLAEELRRERRRLMAKFRREIQALNIWAVHTQQKLGVHKNLLYRLYAGEDTRVSTVQKLCHSLGFKLAIVSNDAAPPPLEQKRFQCPKCGAEIVLPPEDDSGRTTCPECKAALRFKKVVRYVARLDKQAGAEPDPDDG